MQNYLIHPAKMHWKYPFFIISSCKINKPSLGHELLVNIIYVCKGYLLGNLLEYFSAIDLYSVPTLLRHSKGRFCLFLYFYYFFYFISFFVFRLLLLFVSSSNNENVLNQVEVWDFFCNSINANSFKMSHFCGVRIKNNRSKTVWSSLLGGKKE